MTTSASDVSSMVSSLQSSISSALSSIAKRTEDAASTGVTSNQQTVQKSSLNVKATATDVGTLTKDKTRLNVVSSLAAADTVDFYKFTVSEKGAATLGRVGSDGVRLQIMDKSGNVVADSDSSSGAAHDAYTKMTNNTGYTLDKGEYTVRITRNKGESAMTDKDYAFQLAMGQYSQDCDTIAKQPSTESGSSYLSLLTGSSGSTANSLAAFLNGSSSGSDGLASFLSGGSSSSSSSTDISSLISSAKRGSLLNDLL